MNRHPLRQCRHHLDWAAGFGLAIVLALGCQRQHSDKLPSPGPNATQRGDRVIVEAAAGEFVEGTVLEVIEGMAKVQARDEGAHLTVSVGELYRLGTLQTWPPTTSLLVCHGPGERWSACRPTSTTEPQAETDQGQQVTLGPTDWLPASELTTLGLKQRFAELDRRTAFVSQFQTATMVERPHAWKARGNQAVIARRGNDWYSARVHEVTRKVLHLSWDASGTVTEVSPDEVAPQSQHDRAFPSGALALARPASPAEPWRRVQVMRGDEREVTTLDDSGAERRVRTRDLLLLSRDEAPAR
jgi:hypothetical protein